jgi:hypothetical protein
MKGPNRSQRRADRPRGRPKTKRRLRAGLGLASVASLSLLFAGGAQAANPPVNLASAGFFSVLAGSTVTNTGPTTMFGDLGLYPGTSITGAPDALGATYINDPVALDAQNDLVTAFTDAANRPSIALASADLSGQNFTPGVYKASSSLLFSAGDVTLNAEGDPNAVFIFQIGSSMTTQSATTVLLINGAQPCNVFWEVGASATLGTNSRFIGTVMAQTSITAQTGATLDGRLLAQNDHHLGLRRWHHGRPPGHDGRRADHHHDRTGGDRHAGHGGNPGNAGRSGSRHPGQHHDRTRATRAVKERPSQAGHAQEEDHHA